MIVGFSLLHRLKPTKCYTHMDWLVLLHPDVTPQLLKLYQYDQLAFCHTVQFAAKGRRNMLPFGDVLCSG